MIHVVVGVLINSHNEALIAQRPLTQSSGGLWEFPGGKVEPGESSIQALKREFLEEIGIEVLSATLWLELQYDYHDRSVLLDTWLIKDFTGMPVGAEGQLICWVPVNTLDNFNFPAGNKKIIEQLQSLI